MKGLSCEIKFDLSRSVEGEPTSVTLEVVNRFPIPAYGLMIQGKFLQDLIHEDDVIVVALRQVPAWSVSSFEWPLVPSRRGELPSEPPSLVTGFPFGLYQMSKEIETVGSQIVWPKTNELEAQVETFGTQFGIDASVAQQAGNDGETIGVRDYRYGDLVRNIHWSHTARHNRLILRERQAVTQTPVRVVLDLTPAHHWKVDRQDTHEIAIRLAASVCCELHRHQFQIDLVCLGLAEEVPATGSNHRGLNPLLDFFARLPASSDETLFAGTDRGIIEASIANKRTFAFLIHTARLTPDFDPSLARCYCIEPSLDVESVCPTSPFPVVVSAGAKNSYIGAICVPT